MSITSQPSEREPGDVAEATEYLAGRGIPVTAREFRLRQEFHRYGWDMRVREEDGGWTVHALKPDRPEVRQRGSTEGNALRLAVAAALRADEASGS